MFELGHNCPPCPLLATAMETVQILHSDCNEIIKHSAIRGEVREILYFALSGQTRSVIELCVEEERMWKLFFVSFGDSSGNILHIREKNPTHVHRSWWR